MKTLILLRHAKSSWDDPELRDIDRPLNNRGQKAAPRMGSWLRAQGLVPDLVLCSPARRTRDTWALVSSLFEGQIPLGVEHDLYEASAGDILRVVRTANDGAETVLVIGHNPGLEDLARALAGDGGKSDMRRLHKKFPTGAAAVIDFATAKWAEIEPGAGRLRVFQRPKDLD